MIAVLVFTLLSVSIQATPVVYGQPAPVYLQHAPPVAYSAPVVLKDETPKPYSFGYEAPAIGGSSSRHESSDGTGRVTGSYSVTDADGRVRVVEYYADETGFHANVKTNEPGTANQDPADVSVQSYAPPPAAEHVVAEPARVVAPAPPVYTVAAPVRTVARRVVAPRPVTYEVVPAYNTLSHAAPVAYSNGYYGHAPAYGYGSYFPTNYYYK